MSYIYSSKTWNKVWSLVQSKHDFVLYPLVQSETRLKSCIFISSNIIHWTCSADFKRK